MLSDRGAIFDRRGRYRYRLWRVWQPADPVETYVLLNPSTADHTRDDATLRACVRLARAWGSGGVLLVNLFALCATDPARLKQARDPIGPANDRHVADAVAHARRVIVGWGRAAHWRPRAEFVERLLRRWQPRLWCLGLTLGGDPRHPLYLATDTELREFPPRRA